jgi:hypothetical protein
MLDQNSCRYEPHILLVPRDEELQMKSSDPVLHNVHMVGTATYNLPFPIQGMTITRPMRQAGRTHLTCNGGHVWMNGEVLVVTHPYYTITDEHGRYQLTNVPPGEYQVSMWHEGWRIAREETAFDVYTQQHVRRLLFTEPITSERTLSVRPGEAATVDFDLSDK